MTQNLKFKHYYFKLIEDCFTTIRGKTSFNKYDIGEIVDVYIGNVKYCKAMLDRKEVVKIDDLNLEFLKLDAEYKELKINGKQDFVNLINSFLPSFYQQATLESEKTVFYFSKVSI